MNVYWRRTRCNARQKQPQKTFWGGRKDILRKTFWGGRKDFFLWGERKDILRWKKTVSRFTPQIPSSKGAALAVACTRMPCYCLLLLLLCFMLCFCICLALGTVIRKQRVKWQAVILSSGADSRQRKILQLQDATPEKNVWLFDKVQKSDLRLENSRIILSSSVRQLWF